MAISGDIEKLERRWVENPTGLMFAPLAEAYRKAGDQSRALEILEQGLGQHPDYVPALIVRGRCQLDGEGYPEAEAAFQQALDRDPVNPIALRGLAEVFERTGRNGMAIERLEVLLDVDRGDSDARADLARLRALPLVSPAVSSPSPQATPSGQTLDVEPEAHASAIAEEPNLPPAEAPEAPSPAMQWAEWMPGRLNAGSKESATEPEELESLVGFVTNDSDGPMADLLTEDETVAGAEAETSEDVEVEEAAAEPVAEVPDPEPAASKWSSWASGRESKPEATTAEAAEDAKQESSEDAPIGWAPHSAEAEPVEAEAAEAEEEESEAVVQAEDEFDIEAESEMVVEADAVGAAEDEAEDEADALADDEAEAEFEVEPHAEAEAERAAAPVAEENDEEPVAIEELVMTQELIVTESMAELFLRQGHRDLALAVYRQLVVSSGYDHLHDTIADLERTAGVSRDQAQLVPAAAPELAEALTAAKPARRGAAADTGGVSVATFLREVLDAPPPAADSAVLPPAIERGPAGEPTRDAGQALSLSDVFGEEPALAAHPAIPAEERRPVQEPETPAPTEPSYDEFFGAVGTEDEMPGATVGSETEHLEQFNEWLRGLKR